MRRIVSLIGAAAMAVIASLVMPPAPASARPAGVDLEARGGRADGRVGQVVTVGFSVRNNSRLVALARDVTIDVRVPAGTELSGGAPAGCTAVPSGQAVRCRPTANLQPGGEVDGSISVLIQSARVTPGSVRVIYTADTRPGNNVDRLSVQVSGASAPSRSSSADARSSEPQSTEPAPEETITDPAAAFPTTTQPKVASDNGGISAGMWLGGLAILAAVGLLGSLLVLRRRDQARAGEL